MMDLPYLNETFEVKPEPFVPETGTLTMPVNVFNDVFHLFFIYLLNKDNLLYMI